MKDEGGVASSKWQVASVDGRVSRDLRVGGIILGGEGRVAGSIIVVGRRVVSACDSFIDILGETLSPSLLVGDIMRSFICRIPS